MLQSPIFILTDDLSDDEEPLTLISDKSRGKTATRLCKGHAKNGSFCWTVLKPPYFTVAPNRSHKPTNALVFSQIMNRVRKKRTLRAIKATMKLYTVGPMDFCGHAKAVQRGGGWCDLLFMFRQNFLTIFQVNLIVSMGPYSIHRGPAFRECNMGSYRHLA